MKLLILYLEIEAAMVIYTLLEFIFTTVWFGKYFVSSVDAM